MISIKVEDKTKTCNVSSNGTRIDIVCEAIVLFESLVETLADAAKLSFDEAAQMLYKHGTEIHKDIKKENIKEN
jgi:hypothetical protein